MVFGTREKLKGNFFSSFQRKLFPLKTDKEKKKRREETRCPEERKAQTR